MEVSTGSVLGKFLVIRHSKVALRLGLDIASLAESDVVNQIVMISGDSDFVPAAKLARRAGIDFCWIRCGASRFLIR